MKYFLCDIKDAKRDNLAFDSKDADECVDLLVKTLPLARPNQHPADHDYIVRCCLSQPSFCFLVKMDDHVLQHPNLWVPGIILINITKNQFQLFCCV